MKQLKSRKTQMLSVLIGTLLLLSACGGNQNVEEVAEVATAVSTQIIEATSMDDILTASSQVTGSSQIAVIPQVSGTVTEVNVKVGDMVKKGDTLFKVNAVQAGLTGRTTSVSVSANIDGVIGMNNAVVGGMVGQSAIMTIIAMDEVKAMVYVSDREIGNISEGISAHVRIDAASGKYFDGMVTAVSQSPDATMLYPVEVTIKNKYGKIKPGMFTSVDLILKTYKDIMAVPLNTVLRKDGKSYVFLVDDTGRAKKVSVVRGFENAELVQITGGLSLGDEVIVVGHNYLVDGALLAIEEQEENA